MKKKLFSLFVVAIICATALTFTGCGSSSSDTIKIGALGPYSGDTAQYGTATRDGIQLAVDEINDAGGINGQQVELVTYDTKGDSTEAVNAYNRLRDQDEVVAIVGSVLSAESLAIKDLANSDNMPIVTPTSTAADVTLDADNSFRVCYLDEMQGIAAANFATMSADDGGLGAQTAVILECSGNAYSEGLSEAFSTEFEANGGQILGTESYASQDKDFSAQLTKLKSLDADVLYIPDYYSVVGPILQKAKEIGITATCLGGDGWDSVQEEYADAAEGEYFANHYAADSPSEVVQNFITAYTDAYDQAPNSFAALGYDSMNVVKEAIEAAGSTDADAIISALGESDFDGVTGAFTFDENGDPSGKEITIIKIVDGELTYQTTVSSN